MTQKATANMTDDELRDKRDEINDTLMDDMDNKQGSADASADDEKKKYIAQHGDSIKDSERAQDVPQPVTDEVKDLQNDVAEDEHQAQGDDTPEEADEDEVQESEDDKAARIEHGHGSRVTDSQHDKLKDKVNS